MVLPERRLLSCQVKTAPDVAAASAQNQFSRTPLAKLPFSGLAGKIKEKLFPPPKSAADLGFLKKDLRGAGKIFGAGEAKAAELEVHLVFVCLLEGY